MTEDCADTIIEAIVNFFVSFLQTMKNSPWLDLMLIYPINPF